MSVRTANYENFLAAGSVTALYIKTDHIALTTGGIIYTHFDENCKQTDELVT
jgi:hypothetical protein